MNEIVKSILDFASASIGQKEKPGNSGFVNAAFEKQMISVGFDAGEAWCCLFAELCWSQAHQKNPARLAQISAMFTDSALATWNRAKLDKNFKTGLEPRAGAVAIWQHGQSWTGHAGIVTAYDPRANKDFFLTIEGNTNAAGGREGVEVAAKKRQLTFAVKPNQLNLKGFIYPD